MYPHFNENIGYLIGCCEMQKKWFDFISVSRHSKNLKKLKKRPQKEQLSSCFFYTLFPPKYTEKVVKNIKTLNICCIIRLKIEKLFLF